MLSYVTQVTTPVVNLAAAAPSGGVAPPTTQEPTVTPTVIQATPYGGKLTPATYFVFYTYTYANGIESLPSPASAPFTVAAGNVPMVILPRLAESATGLNLYLSDATGGSGPAVRDATGLMSTTFMLQ